MWFLYSLIVTIIMHETGHLITAKYCKCQVDVFSIGFGRPIFKKKIGKTIYQISPFLLGGYCKLKNELSYSRSKYAFTNLIYRKKVLIALAGVTINIIVGVPCLLLGNSFISYFGAISVALGITNALPIPALDGSYPILVWLEKIYGKKKGYAKMNKICSISFIILMALNVLCLPYLIYLMGIGVIK